MALSIGMTAENQKIWDAAHSVELPKVDKADIYIRTYTGGKFHPFAPKPDEVSILDIAHSLSQQCRFSGHTRKFYSVAQHSVLVARHLTFRATNFLLAALLHDAPEAYLVDLPTPIKRNVSFTDEWRRLDSWIADSINEAFWVTTAGTVRIIKEIDHRMLLTEQRDLMCGADLNEMNIGWRGPVLEPFDFTIEPWSCEQAEEEFLTDFREYMKLRASD